MPTDFKTRFLIQVGIASGVVVAIALVMFFLGQDIKNTTEGLLETRAGANARLRQLDDLARLQEEAKLAEPKLEVLKGALPNKDGLFTFPDEVVAFGTANDVAARFGYGDEQADSIGFSLTAVGTYTEVTKFIDALENEYFFMTLSGFDVIRIGEDQYQGSVSGRIFFTDDGGEE